MSDHRSETGRADAPEAVEVREVVSRRDRRAFLLLPWRLYASDPVWVPPLLKGMRATLDPKRNPVFRHAEIRLFVAWRAGRPVGRISATVDSLHNEYRYKKTGFWGYFETENEAAVAGALLDRAAADLRERGMTEMQGPLSPSSHGQCGLLVEGFDEPPAVSMPYNPAYYPDLVEEAGLKSVEELYGYHITFDNLGPGSEMMQRLERLARGIRRRHPDLTVRPIDMAHYETALLALGKLADTALEENTDHVPFTEEEMRSMAREVQGIIDPDLVLLAELDGAPVGCVFGLPDINPLLRKINGRLFPFGWLKFLLGKRSIRSARIIGWAALAEYRHMGVMPLLMYNLIRNAQRRGYRDAELSWIAEENIKAFRTLERAIAPRLSKRYRIYARDL